MCTDCPTGQYSAAPAATGCLGCTIHYDCSCDGGCTSSIAGSVCQLGYYSVGFGCTQCPAGHFGSTSNLTAASCSGPCAPGYYCPAGSINNTAVVCPLGQFSLGDAATCTPCQAGRFGSSTGLNASTCSGLCAAGQYGATAGLHVSTCSGACAAGYRCSPGSLRATAAMCPIGQYSLAGATACTNCEVGRYGQSRAIDTALCTSVCPPGRYGSSSGLNSSSCTGPCAAGYYCISAATTMFQHTCAMGQYSLAGSSSCTPCPPGRYGSVTALPNASCSGPCDAGYYGATSNLTNSACSGPCPLGTYSLAGSTNCTLCPLGSFGDTTAQMTATCSGLCSAGKPLDRTLLQQSLLFAEYICVCCGWSGRYGAIPGQTSLNCSGPCDAGYYCPLGSTSSMQLQCSVGQYSNASASSCTSCPLGQYGETKGLSNVSCSGPCAAGFFGASVGQSSSSCSGPCPAGEFRCLLHCCCYGCFLLFLLVVMFLCCRCCRRAFFLGSCTRCFAACW